MRASLRLLEVLIAPLLSLHASGMGCVGPRALDASTPSIVVRVDSAPPRSGSDDAGIDTKSIADGYHADDRVSAAAEGGSGAPESLTGPLDPDPAMTQGVTQQIAQRPIRVDDDPLVGMPAPDFAAASANGKGEIALLARSGKVVIVAFWATWCEPCKRSFPKLEDIYVRFKASGLTIIGVSEDDDSDGLADFGKTYGAKFPLVWDNGKAIAMKWRPRSIPCAFIVDKNGIVRFAHMGYHDGVEAEVEKEVRSLL
jgi:cytochrome c biogenesis protein CcmG, thiol:disulfide interchange protein DsbE